MAKADEEVGLPLYKLDQAEGAFVPFEEKPFGDLEQKLEEWVEANPHLIAGEDRFVIFGRQVRTTFGRIVDLLALDESGAVVVIELKRGETPRQVIAQALEYAAWVDSLGLDDLNAIAERYTARNGGSASDLVELYDGAFTGSVDENDDEEAELDSESDRVTFNNSQRVVIVAEEFSGEVEQTLRYLRSRKGLDISGVAFSIHESGGELLIQTETVVGREQPLGPIGGGKPRPPLVPFGDDEIRERAGSAFVRDAVGVIEDWVSGLERPDVELKVGKKTSRAVYLKGKRTSRFYYARDWIYGWLKDYTSDELQILTSQLAVPAQVVADQPKQGYVRFHLTTSSDLAVYERILAARFDAEH